MNLKEADPQFISSSKGASFFITVSLIKKVQVQLTKFYRSTRVHN